MTVIERTRCSRQLNLLRDECV